MVKAEEIGGERDGDFMINSCNTLVVIFLTLLIPLKRGDRG